MRWRLTLTGDAFYTPSTIQQSSYSKNVYISEGSSIHYNKDPTINIHYQNHGKNSNTDESFDINAAFHSKENDDKSLTEIIRKRWGALTTFSRISGANRISISLPQGMHLDCGELH